MLRMHTAIRLSTCAILPALLVIATARRAHADDGCATAPAVFTQTNAADRNAIVEYARGPGGELTLVGQWDTGGTGLGTGLPAQGALALAGRWLFVVNAGSNDVTTFDLATTPPSVVSRVASGGTQPVSVTVKDHVVYVLDAGGAGNIAGFHVDFEGKLHSIAGSTLPLSAGALTPTEVSFAPDGDTLVVTEKGTNRIDAYYVDDEGLAFGPTVNASDGPTPFGFDFSPTGELFVSEAAGSAASAYAIRGEVDLVSLAASVPNTQAAACWLVAAPDGRFVFTANAGSGTISSYRVEHGGGLALDEAVAGVTGAATSHPVDMAFASGGKYLFALANGAGTITAFRVEGGSLTGVGSVGGLPASATGIVAR